MNTTQQKFCKNCGAALGPGVLFCEQCGQPVTKPILNKPQNRERTTALVLTILAVIFVVAIFVPSLLEMDMMSRGYALSVISLFLVICFGVAAAFYWNRASRLDKILSGEILVHWTYQPAEWQSYTRFDFEEEKSEKRALYIVVAVISLVIGLLFWIFAEEGGIVMLVMLGLLAVLAVFAFGMPYLTRARNLRGPGDVYIAPGGAFMQGAFQQWQGFGVRLAGVELLPHKKNMPAILVFTIGAISRTGEQEYIVRIPVPAGHEDEAQKLLEYFSHS